MRKWAQVASGKFESGRISSWKEWLGVGSAVPVRWCLGTWFSCEHGSLRCMIRLSDVESLFQYK